MDYHIGIIQRGHTLIFQARTSIDCLSCEILEYLGEWHTTKKQLRANVSDKVTRVSILAKYNDRYPDYKFKYIRVD